MKRKTQILASPTAEKESNPVFRKLKDKGLIDESYVAMDRVNEICNKVEPGEQKEYCKYCGYTTIHKNGICVVCESQPQPEPTDEMVIDLKQYITNLMYNAYNDGKQELSTAVFDTWVEAEWDNIDHFFKSRDGKIGKTESKVVAPSGAEEILKKLLDYTSKESVNHAAPYCNVWGDILEAMEEYANQRDNR